MPSDGGFTRLNWRARESPEGTDGTTSVASFMWFWDTATQSYLPSWVLLTAQLVHRLRIKISSSHFCTPSRDRSLSTTDLSERRLKVQLLPAAYYTPLCSVLLSTRHGWLQLGSRISSANHVGGESQDTAALACVRVFFMDWVFSRYPGNAAACHLLCACFSAF